MRTNCAAHAGGFLIGVVAFAARVGIVRRRIVVSFTYVVAGVVACPIAGAGTDPIAIAIARIAASRGIAGIVAAIDFTAAYAIGTPATATPLTE